MARTDDITRVDYILDNCENVSYGGKTDAYRSWQNGKNRKVDTVLYKKQTDDKSWYVVQAVPEAKKRTLYIVTAFVGKSGYKNGASQVANADGLAVTSETEVVSTPEISVADDHSRVKQKFSVEDSPGPLPPVLPGNEEKQNYDSEERNNETAEANNADQAEEAWALAAGSAGGLSDSQKAVLWQLANKSWKPKINPYSVSIGQKVHDALNGE